MPRRAPFSLLTIPCSLDRLTPRCRTALHVGLLSMPLLVVLPQRVLLGLLVQGSFILLLGAGLFPERAREGWRKATPMVLVFLAIGLTSVAGCGQGAATKSAEVASKIKETPVRPAAKPAVAKPRLPKSRVTSTPRVVASTLRPRSTKPPVQAPVVPSSTPEKSRERFGTALQQVYKALAKAPNKTAEFLTTTAQKTAQP
jgi:hypothetical protein